MIRVLEGVGKEVIEGSRGVGEEVIEGSRGVAEIEGEVIKTGTLKSLGNKIKELSSYMWDNKGAFAKVVGSEAAKGAAFMAGMEATQTLWEDMFKTDPSAINKRRLDIIHTINAERRKTNPILQEWQQWLSDHFDTRDTYGTVRADDTDISLFMIVQNKISGIRNMDTEHVQPAADDANELKDIASAEILLSHEKDYAQKLVDLSTYIQTKCSTMTAGGFQNHHTELEAARKSLDTQQ